MTTEVFELKRFNAINGATLHEYASGMLAQGAEAFVGVDYDEVVSLLRCADEYHSVYLLELCAKLDSIRSAPIAASYLSSRVASLCCAASRVLGEMQPDAMSSEVRSLIEECPVVELYWDDPTSGVSRRVGTNEVFLSEHREKLGIASETTGQ